MWISVELSEFNLFLLISGVVTSCLPIFDVHVKKQMLLLLNRNTNRKKLKAEKLVKQIYFLEYMILTLLNEYSNNKTDD